LRLTWFRDPFTPWRRFITVITISRQFGSLGSQVAREAAELLGYKLVWRDLINQSALRAGAPATALAVIDELGLLGISLTKKEARLYSQALRQVMEELYEAGNAVIVGRAGQIILQEKPGVLHVRVVAPVGLRADRIAKRQHISVEKALAQVEASDKNRRKFVQRLFETDWDSSDFYDLILNTTRLTVQDCAGLIVIAVSQVPDKVNKGGAGVSRQ